MSERVDYMAQHWTSVLAQPDYHKQPPLVVTVNDRAATRQAIVNRARQEKLEFVERSDWAAHKNKPEEMKSDWRYSMIAIHHAGRSYSCGPASLQLQETQDMHMRVRHWPDIGYHYAVDCFGNIYEGRDIGFKGSHLSEYNSGAIGIVLLENLSEPEDKEDGTGRVLSLMKTAGLFHAPVVSEAQRQGLMKFITILREFFDIKQLGGHQEFPNQQSEEGRLCPGSHGMRLVKELRTWSKLLKPT